MKSEVIHPRVFKIIDSCADIKQLENLVNRLPDFYKKPENKLKVIRYLEIKCLSFQHNALVKYSDGLVQYGKTLFRAYR